MAVVALRRDVALLRAVPQAVVEVLPRLWPPASIRVRVAVPEVAMPRLLRQRRFPRGSWSMLWMRRQPCLRLLHHLEQPERPVARQAADAAELPLPAVVVVEQAVVAE